MFKLSYDDFNKGIFGVQEENQFKKLIVQIRKKILKSAPTE